jgi:hypothetical protein
MLNGTTPFYVGNLGETACLIDAMKDENLVLLKDLLPYDRVVTDKGFNLRDVLREMFGALHVKPTEMAKGTGDGMSYTDASRSRKVAQIRAVTERFVLEFKWFDIFGWSRRRCLA